MAKRKWHLTDAERKSLASRFWPRVSHDVDSDCWIWTGSVNKLGYGTMGVGSRSDGSERTVAVHRVAYELQNGPIPRGLNVLHHCDNPPCVRGDHLYAGTMKQNSQDRERRGRSWQSKVTHCPKGHPYSPENTRWPKNGKRIRTCIACDRVRPRRSPSVTNPRPTKMTPAVVSNILRLRASGKTYKQVAASTGLCESSIAEALKRAGVTRQRQLN